jgi:ribosomal protein L37AE/L43A
VSDEKTPAVSLHAAEPNHWTDDDIKTAKRLARTHSVDSSPAGRVAHYLELAIARIDKLEHGLKEVYAATSMILQTDDDATMYDACGAARRAAVKALEWREEFPDVATSGYVRCEEPPCTKCGTITVKGSASNAYMCPSCGWHVEVYPFDGRPIDGGQR